MIPIRFQPGIDERARAFAEGFVCHVLESCAPEVLLDRSDLRLDTAQPIHILAFGKASMGMARWCVDALEESFAGGVVLAPESLIEPIHPKLTIQPADHPHPTQRNIDATSLLRAYAEAIPDNHACVVCISGGGSAHLCSPRPGVTLRQIIDTTKSLNESGEGIHQLNAARRELETLKGGGLASTLAHVACKRAFVLSDVIGDDLATIASGAMMSQLHPVPHIIVGNHVSAAGSARSFLGGGAIVYTRISGDAQQQGRALAAEFVDACAPVLFAGETTVDVKGSTGRGGPCMETALACAQALLEAGMGDWLVLGLASDGIDGPTDAAGAVITATMINRGARAALADHDTLGYLDSIGATIRTGATGTNVNDLCVVVPWERAEVSTREPT